MRHTCIAAALVVLAGPAEAENAPTYRHGSVTALAGTDVGLDVALGLQIELPIRVRLTGTAGWLPGGYAWILNKYYTDIFDGRPAVGELLNETVKNAFVARGMLGIRPAARRGLFVDGTYTFVISEKDGLVAGVIENAAALGLREALPFTNTFETTVRVHLVGAQVGWQWGIGPGWSLRAAIGFVTVFRSHASFEPNFTPKDPDLTRRIIRAAEAQIEDAGDGVTAPVGSLFLGYTF